MQMIAGINYCPYLSQKQQKGCFDTQKPLQMQPASKNAGGKKLLSKRLKGKDPNSHFETP